MPSDLSPCKLICALEPSDSSRECTDGLLCLRRKKECREVRATAVKAAHTILVPPARTNMHTAVRNELRHVLGKLLKGAAPLRVRLDSTGEFSILLEASVQSHPAKQREWEDTSTRRAR